jgi:hypothetical protein
MGLVKVRSEAFTAAKVNKIPQAISGVCWLKITNISKTISAPSSGSDVT